MLNLLIVLSMLFGPITPSRAQISVGVALPGVSIGINMPRYPELVLVPNSPVYYAPRANSNFFFYDGLYWVYREDNWYSSDWYNGPWQSVEPMYIPLFVLRVPVRYYRQPPAYFHGWRADAPPRWGNHWGRDWEDRRHGWDRWDRRSVPVAAPLPAYQKKFSGNRYPHEPEQQHAIRSENYRYQPREAVTPRSSPQAPGNSRSEARQRAPSPIQQAPPTEQRPPPAMRPTQADRQDTRRENQAAPAHSQAQGNAGNSRAEQQTVVQPPPPAQQRPPREAQDRGRDNRAEPQDRGRQNDEDESRKNNRR